MRKKNWIVTVKHLIYWNRFVTRKFGWTFNLIKKLYDTIYKEIAYQAIENNRDEPDVDIPESGKIPLYVR